jgi:hypothetical protein
MGSHLPAVLKTKDLLYFCARKLLIFWFESMLESSWRSSLGRWIQMAQEPLHRFALAPFVQRVAALSDGNDSHSDLSIAIGQGPFRHGLATNRAFGTVRHCKARWKSTRWHRQIWDQTDQDWTEQ